MILRMLHLIDIILIEFHFLEETKTELTKNFEPF